MVHNLSSNINVVLETRVIKFIHNSLTHNNVCRQLLLSKLFCKNSCFADNYRFLSYKYEISASDWEQDLSYLMGKVKMKLKCLYPPPFEVETLRELCDMRESTWQNVFTSAELECLIENICTK